MLSVLKATIFVRLIFNQILIDFLNFTLLTYSSVCA